ncbi:MAG TPA: aldo/keto reductase [Prolixibacteraceae bacterium]|mgnify:CR=1 FL=1|nr:aldo/keto reductase [Prolixibacteraceae bacterium]
MRYRLLGNTNEKVSIIGFGCMRLPILDGNMGKIDEEKAGTMIRYAIDQGVNYVDTAWSYHSSVMGQKGESEPFVGRLLAGGYREKVNIATKLPTWLVHSRRDMDDLLDAQLERLQTGTIDFYLLHALAKPVWEKLKSLGIREFLDKALASGKIRYAGFSYHDNTDLFREIVDSYDWSFCQIQYNLLDEDFQAGRAGLQYASEKGLGVIVMEPLRGGKLVKGVPGQVLNIYHSVHPSRTPAQWALRWVWNQPEVGLALSGMNTMEDVRQNLEAASEGDADALSRQETLALNQVKAFYSGKIRVNCTTCAYCMPCPSGVNIPGNFSYFNDYFMFDSPKARENTIIFYHHFIQPDASPSACIECGQCEEKCPQKIPIIEELKRVGELFI